MLEDRTTPTPVITIVKGADAYEGVSNGSFTLTRTDDPNFPISQPLSVNVSISGAGTATPGQDYQYITSNVTFAAGSATATVTVNVMGSPYDDSTVEPDETVILNIAGPGANYTIGNPSSATVIIVDNDTPSNNYYWVGDHGTSWSTVGNWALDAMGQTRASDVPHGPRDNVYFDGRTGAYPSVGAGGYSGYKSLHMVYGYASTLELSSVTFGTFEQTSGTIDQPSATTNLVVTESFNWSGGTLNSTQNLATVTLTGNTMTGSIAPLGGGSVSLGSNIKLLNGAVLNLGQGTLSRINYGMEMDVDAGSQLNISPGTTKSFLVTGAATVDRDYVTITNGSFKLLTGTFSDSERCSNTGGQFTLMSDTHAIFSGVAGQSTTYTYFQSAGGTSTLYGGSTLETGSGYSVRIGAGTLQTIVEPTGNSVATIKTYQLNVENGDVLIGGGGTGHNYGTLKVMGSVRWTGGTYRPVVYGEMDGGDADLWYATGTFSVGSTQQSTPALAPVAIDSEGLEMTPQQANMRWLIIESDTAVAADNNNVPSIGSSWCVLDPVNGNPVKQWQIKSVTN